MVGSASLYKGMGGGRLDSSNDTGFGLSGGEGVSRRTIPRLCTVKVTMCIFTFSCIP